MLSDITAVADMVITAGVAMLGLLYFLVLLYGMGEWVWNGSGYAHTWSVWCLLLSKLILSTSYFPK